MSKKGARKSKTWCNYERTDTRRWENRRRRAVMNQKLREAFRDGEFEDFSLPRFRGTEGYLDW